MLDQIEIIEEITGVSGDFRMPRRVTQTIIMSYKITRNKEGQ